MATAGLLIIGSEMVDPSRPDANGPHARIKLAELGIPLTLLVRVEDRVEAVASAMETALKLCDVVITSGGLGPTGDDLTREAAARYLGVGIHEDLEWAAELERRMSFRGRPLGGNMRRQALVVDGGEALPNGKGLACGCWLKKGDRDLILLPGIPREFQDILDNVIAPRLARKYTDQPATAVVRAIVAGVPESSAEKVLSPWYEKPGVDVSILPALGILRITFTLTSPPAGPLDALEESVRKALAEGYGANLVSLEGTELPQHLGEVLLEKDWTLATAESCTAGFVSQKIVSVPGASRYYMGGVTAYHNEAKRTLLGVPQLVLENRGAVSEETARAMVRGARARFGASCAVATTGIAGPTGGTEEKPAGTVWVAAGTPDGEWAGKFVFPLDRVSFMELSANYALFFLWRCVTGRKAP